MAVSRRPKGWTRPAPKVKGSGTAGYIAAILAIQTISIAFEAPLRFGLAKLHLSNILYLRDLLIFSCVMAMLWRPPAGDEGPFLKSRLQWLLFMVSVAFFTAVLMGNGIFSALFALKLFNITLFGLACTIVADKRPEFVTKLVIFLFISTALGIFLNKAVGQFPWDGESIETAFGTVEVNRVWWITGGERRLAGFCRASYTAAAILAITGSMLLFLTQKTLLKLAVAAVALAAIYMTTTKGVVISLVAVIMVSLAPAKSYSRSTLFTFWSIFFALLALTTPFISWYLELPANSVRTAPSMLSSFADRTANTWPEFLKAYQNWYNWILGKGLGGVGLASSFSSKLARVNPVDNIHMFIYGNLGLVGSALFGVLALRMITTARSRQISTTVSCACAVALVLVGYGTVTNIVDDPFSPIALAMAWGLMTLAARRELSAGAGERKPAPAPLAGSKRLAPPHQH
jgi:hypothetical protein